MATHTDIIYIYGTFVYNNKKASRLLDSPSYGQTFTSCTPAGTEVLISAEAHNPTATKDGAECHRREHPIHRHMDNLA